MDITEKSLFTKTISVMNPRHMVLAITARKERGKVTELVAALMAERRLQIMAGSDWVPGYDLARALRRRTVGVAQVLEDSSLSRAFTCYQLLHMLGAAVTDSKPLLVLDFLHTFYDADIPYPVRFRILKQCCQHLQRLSLGKPVVVMLQHTSAEDYQHFFPFLAAIADEILVPETITQEASQLGLF